MGNENIDVMDARAGLEAMMHVVNSISVAYIACRFASDHPELVKSWAERSLGHPASASVDDMKDDLVSAATLMNMFHDQMVRALATGNAGIGGVEKNDDVTVVKNEYIDVEYREV